MKTIAFIPIKMNNERVPGKNTKKFQDGTPLIQFIQNTLISSKVIDEVYVYCSREEIQEYLLPGVTYIKRDPSYDTAQANVNEMFYAFSKIVDADIYVLAHATAPFLKIESIERGIKAVQSGKYDSAVAAKKMQDFIWIDGKAFNYDPQNIPRTQDLQPIYVETTGCYIFTKKVIQNKRSRIGEKPYIFEVDKFESVDINDPEDFIMADALNYYNENVERVLGGVNNLNINIIVIRKRCKNICASISGEEVAA